MRKYHRLCIEEREEIYRLKRELWSNKKIARYLGREVSTIGRELKRNANDNIGYLPDSAQSNADKKASIRRSSKSFRTQARRTHIIGRLKYGWSPEQISGRLKYKKSPIYLCHESIYRWIYSEEGKAANWYQYLRRKHKRRWPKYGRRARPGISDTTPISLRPEIINSREEFGHWEGDLLIFTKTSPNITTMVERKSRYVLLSYNENKVTGKVMYNLKSKLKRMPPCARRSITFDRGAEFASHKQLNYSLNMGTYFCNPYSPWEKGSNENFNGRLRRFFPKKVIPTDLSQTKLNEIQKIMNDTPRKCLGYKTPTEAFRYLRKISSP